MPCWSRICSVLNQTKIGVKSATMRILESPCQRWSLIRMVRVLETSEYNGIRSKQKTFLPVSDRSSPSGDAVSPEAEMSGMTAKVTSAMV
jgi:hypothetical protein